MRHHRRHHAARLAALAALLLVAGCASAPKDEGPHPAWPGPPALPRIVHRSDVTGAAPVGKVSALSQLGRWIVGENPQRLALPNCAAVAGNTLYVTDQDLQGLHVISLRSDKMRFVSKAGDKHFVSPVGVAVCGDRVAVADSALNKVYLLTLDGKPAGTIDNPGGFARPTGLAWDETHRELYVVDTLANEVCVFDLAGKLLRRFGSPGIEVGQFHYPTHVAVDAQRRVYVSDSMNFRVQVLDHAGGYVSVIGELGDASGYMAIPKGVCVDSFGHVYVVDSYLSNVQVFDAAGQLLLYFGEPGEARGEFRVPTGLAVDADNNIYVCDSQNHRIQVFQYVGGSNDEPQ